MNFFNNNYYRIESRSELIDIKYGRNRHSTHISISGNISRLWGHEFEDCTNLIQASFSAGMKEIGDSSFKGCSSLTEVSFPDTLTHIQYEAFSGCSSLTNVTIPKNVKEINDKAFYDCSSLTDIALPEGITHINCRLFSGCSSLESITLPQSITHIEIDAFSCCHSLRDITLPENVTYIGMAAFHRCRGLTHVTIPKSVTRMSVTAFIGCENLTHLTLPENVKLIDTTCFRDYSCSEFSKLTIIIDSNNNKKINKIKAALPKLLQDKVTSKALYEEQQENKAKEEYSEFLKNECLKIREMIDESVNAPKEIKKHFEQFAPFHQCCDEIDKKYKDLVKRGEKAASNEARQLKDALLLAFGQYAFPHTFKNKNEPDRMEKFQQACLDALNASRPVLEKHRGWSKVFANLSIALLTLGVGLIGVGIGNYCATGGKHFFFHPKTDSEKIVDHIQQSVLELREYVPMGI